MDMDLSEYKKRRSKQRKMQEEAFEGTDVDVHEWRERTGKTEPEVDEEYEGLQRLSKKKKQAAWQQVYAGTKAEKERVRKATGG